MKKMLRVLFALSLTVGMVSSAGAWEIQMHDAYVSGDYWLVDIEFDGLVTDNLNDLNLSVMYDTTQLEYIATDAKSYDDGGFPVASATWEGAALGAPVNIDDISPTTGLIYNIMGGEILGNAGVFFPEASGETLLFTLYFTDLDAADDTDIYFTHGLDYNNFAVDAVSVNGENYSNDIPGKPPLIYSDKVLSDVAVPVPAAAWLLGSGLLGLVGIRRRNG
ncbi:MAG: hypothetical protein CSA20_01965 [Deltaproteobacteria bacterium]|nr:MAG: hypothetical protein CSA20_01965 [Deltaproteobacteria bacterium]